MAINMDGNTYDSVGEFFEMMDGMVKRGLMKEEDIPDTDKYREYLAQKEKGNEEPEAEKTALTAGDLVYEDKVEFTRDYEDMAGDSADKGDVGEVNYVDDYDGYVSISNKRTGSIWVNFEDVPTTLKRQGEKMALEDSEADIEEAAEFKVGDKVRLLDARNPVRVFAEEGAIGTVVNNGCNGSNMMSIEIENTSFGDIQVVRYEQVELVKPIAQDANGEDLYEGDIVTGVNNSPYGYTTNEALMMVSGKMNCSRRRSGVGCGTS